MLLKDQRVGWVIRLGHKHDSLTFATNIAHSQRGQPLTGLIRKKIILRQVCCLHYGLDLNRHANGQIPALDGHLNGRILERVALYTYNRPCIIPLE